jgi:hypothetical protein
MEFLKEKEYELLSEAEYFDTNGILHKTSKVKMFALKFCEIDSIDETNSFTVLKFLCQKGYIAPIQGGKIKLESVEFRTAKILHMEYHKSFLDTLPFSPKE